MRRLQMLGRLLDRGHLEAGRPHPYPAEGRGYQVVAQQESAGVLKSVS